MGRMKKLKLGIISDTHINKDLEFINKFIKNCLGDMDMILHLGDYMKNDVVNILKNYKGFVGVWGNADDGLVKNNLKEKEIVKIQNYRIGLYHGHGKSKTTIDRAYEIFMDDYVDVIIFGHSHMPLIMTKNRILFINPGSPSSKRKERWYSYAVLDIQEAGISAAIRLYEDKLKLF